MLRSATQGVYACRVRQTGKLPERHGQEERIGYKGSGSLGETKERDGQ